MRRAENTSVKWLPNPLLCALFHLAEPAICGDERSDDRYVGDPLSYSVNPFSFVHSFGANVLSQKSDRTITL